MKTMPLNRTGRFFRRKGWDRRLQCAAAAAVLGLATVSLFAGATVNWISGGPNTGYPSGAGYVNGDITTEAEYNTPSGLAIDSTGNFLLVADRGNNAIRVLEFDINTTYTFANMTNYVATTNLLSKPVGVAIDPADDVYALNYGKGTNGYVLEFDNTGELLATNLSGITNAGGIALDPAGNLYVTASNRVYKVAAGGGSSVIATITNAGTSLQGIAAVFNGTLAVCDSGNDGIWLINPAATNSYSPLSGFHGPGDFADLVHNLSISNLAKYFQPSGVTAGGDGTLVICDFGNDRVKAVLPNGYETNIYGVASNYWENPYPGFEDGTVSIPDQPFGVAARCPKGVVLAPDGSLYVTEDYYHIIRHVTGAGMVLPPPPPPVAPTGLMTTTNYGEVILTWNAVSGATSYNVQRSTTSGGPYELLANVTTNAYTDSSVVNGTTYYYVVAALDGTTVGPNSAQVSATPPLPPLSDPQIGYVTFPASSSPVAYTAVFNAGNAFAFNNDTPIVILGAGGTITYFTYSNTPNASLVPNPTSSSGTAPQGYQNGDSSAQVMAYDITQITQPMPYLSLKAISENGVNPNSQMVSATIQFITANPSITGNNLAQFTVNDITSGAQMLYTTDGSDPLTNVTATLIGPVTGTNGLTLSLQFPAGTNSILFQVAAFKNNYQTSSIVSQVFSASNFVANTISLGFASGEASSDFVASPGQIFYAPVTLTTLSGAVMYSLQFNITVTNAAGSPPVGPGTYGFVSMLAQPDPVAPGLYIPIPPYAFVSEGTSPPPPVDTNIVIYNGNYFQDLEFQDTNINLLGVGWLERYGQTNLYDTLSQNLLTYSIAHDVLYPNPTYPNQVEVGGYAFVVPPTAVSNDVYQIQIGRPSATSDGIGANGSSVYIAAPTNGALAGGAPINALKNVTIGQIKYLVGSVTPFRWFNAGDFGSTNIVNADVEQVFQSAAYNLDDPPPGSDFFDAMDSCGNIGILDSNPADPNNGYYTNTATFPDPYYYTVTNYTYIFNTNNVATNMQATAASQVQLQYLTTSYLETTYTITDIYPYSGVTTVNTAHSFIYLTPTVSTLFDGNDTDINEIAFGDGVLDVCDVYVTFRRSLDPTLTWFRRFWNNGQRVADTGAPNVGPQLATQSPATKAQTQTSPSGPPPQVNFAAGDAVAAAGQTVQIPITANIFGNYPLRVLMLNLSVEPLDGSPALTTPITFTPNSALGEPTSGLSGTTGNGNYSAAWLDSTIAGLNGNATLGTLTVTLPANATSLSAYDVHFDHASASPNGIASFPKQTLTGVITLSSRTNSCYGDGIPDLWRLRWFGTTNNLLSVSNACPSGDGIDNWQKYVAGVNPNAPNDFPSTSIQAPPSAGVAPAIQWPSVYGVQYVVLRSTSLFPGSWTTISTNVGTGAMMNFNDATASQAGFYRVQILPP
ncbi:MAG: hypothetical protein ABSE16_16150 [Verrucomicrobiota bacterium]|jgi:hypothetical protein